MLHDAEDSAIGHEMDLGKKFGELITEYKLVYGRRGDPRMVCFLKDVIDVLFKVQGSTEPEIEFIATTLKSVPRRLKLHGWNDRQFMKAIETMLGELSTLTKDGKKTDSEKDFGDWPHP